MRTNQTYSFYSCLNIAYVYVYVGYSLVCVVVASHCSVFTTEIPAIASFCSWLRFSSQPMYALHHIPAVPSAGQDAPMGSVISLKLGNSPLSGRERGGLLSGNVRFSLHKPNNHPRKRNRLDCFCYSYNNTIIPSSTSFPLATDNCD